MEKTTDKNKTEDFLLEIGVEPLPARFLFPAMESLRLKMEEGLKAHRLEFKSARVLGTPRRLAVLIEGLALKSAAMTEKFYGPPASRLKNPDGSYSAAAEGFARKYNATPDKLLIETTPKGEQSSILVETPGRNARDILGPLCLDAISSLEFPKSMEWEESRFRFARPIRSLISLLGSSPVSISIAGVKNGRNLRGLNGAIEKISKAQDYRKILKNSLVLADPQERREVLLKKLAWSAAEVGGEWDKDLTLLDEIVAMTEHPVCVAGRFDERFLGLPEPLIILVLKKQLKFFPLLAQGRLINAFVGVRDGISEGQAIVKEGFERVLTARLSDAVFFFEKDLKTPLDSYLAGLARVTYQKDLGSIEDRSRRVEKLSGVFFEALKNSHSLKKDATTTIARLCFADLTTGLVKEFPELQGTMGGVYARLEGQDERVALGLEEFYYPMGPQTPIPTTDEGCLVSLAGKLDALAGCFAAGLIPTGSADPYALRRQAFGVIRIALERQWPLDIQKAAEAALKLQPVSLEGLRFEEVLTRILDFLWGRAQSFFEEKGFAVDEIRSVKAVGLKNLSRTYLRLSALKTARSDSGFEPLTISFKRASNILKQADFKDDAEFLGQELIEEPDRGITRGSGDSKVRWEEPEIGLRRVLDQIEREIESQIVADDFKGALASIARVKPALDLFFEKTMVMVEDPDLRRSRLKLLSRLVCLFNQVADLSELQGPSSK